MIYTCDECRFIFESERKINNCPDCGSREVRPATEFEKKEHTQFKKEADIYYQTLNINLEEKH